MDHRGEHPGIRWLELRLRKRLRSGLVFAAAGSVRFSFVALI
jgi:hypothetical protein